MKLRSNSKTRSGKHLPYVNNPNYLSSVYNVDEEKTISRSDQSYSDSKREIAVSDSNDINEQNQSGNVPLTKRKYTKKQDETPIRSNKGSSNKKMSKAIQRNISSYNYDTPCEKKDGIMGFEDLGFESGHNHNRSENSTIRRKNVSAFQNSSSKTKKPFTNSFLSYNPNQGLKGVFAESTKHHNNQKSGDNSDDRCLRKRAKIEMPKKNSDYSDTDEENCNYGNNKNIQKNHHISPMDAKKGRKERNIKNIGDCRVIGANQLPAPILPIFKNN